MSHPELRPPKPSQLEGEDELKQQEIQQKVRIGNDITLSKLKLPILNEYQK